MVSSPPVCRYRDLAVDRAILYRWVGSREQLIAEVLWSLMEPTITRLRNARR